MPKLDHHSSEKTVELDHIQADHQAREKNRAGPPRNWTTKQAAKKTRAGPKSKQATHAEVVQLTRETVYTQDF